MRWQKIALVVTIMHTHKALLLTTFIFAITLIVTASSTLDWDLSHSLVAPGSTFGEFFNRFGELPVFFALLLSTVLLFGSRNRQVAWRNIFSHIFALPFMALFAWAIFFVPVRYIHEFNPSGIPHETLRLTQILGMALLFAAIVAAYRLPPELCRKYRRPALLIISLIALEIVLINLLKIAWGRPRMRSIDSIEQFHYWYQIAGPAPSDEFKSFPSGHTANGFMVIALALLIPAQKTSLIRGFTLFALLWGICVALSRVVLGAHFLSDVATGGYIALCLYFSLRGLARQPVIAEGAN